jgi:hypothetical protein
MRGLEAVRQWKDQVPPEGPHKEHVGETHPRTVMATRQCGQQEDTHRRHKFKVIWEPSLLLQK